MPIIDAYGERKAMQVRQDTWGHLAPKPRRRYKGTILFAESEYGGQGRTIIRTDFEDLPSSPWFYESMCDFIYGLEGIEEGSVYRWTGTYQFLAGRKGGYLDQGSFRFDGKVELVPIE